MKWYLPRPAFAEAMADKLGLLFFDLFGIYLNIEQGLTICEVGRFRMTNKEQRNLI
jgi:hypothetical protein